MALRKRSPLIIKTTDAQSCSIFTRLDILAQVSFFHDLTHDELEWINSLFHEEDFKVNETIYHLGDPAEHLYVVADGRVKLLRYSYTGKEILLDLLKPREFFGAVSGQVEDIYTDTAQAHTSCCILAIGREAFKQILLKHPAVAVKVIDIMAIRLREANERVHQLSALPIEARIASILLMLGDKFGEKSKTGLLLQVPLSREDLAGMTGTTTESASRVMSQLQKDSLIHSGRGWVAITDRSGLEVVAGKELE